MNVVFELSAMLPVPLTELESVTPPYVRLVVMTSAGAVSPLGSVVTSEGTPLPFVASTALLTAVISPSVPALLKRILFVALPLTVVVPTAIDAAAAVMVAHERPVPFVYCRALADPVHDGRVAAVGDAVPAVTLARNVLAPCVA